MVSLRVNFSRAEVKHILGNIEKIRIRLHSDLTQKRAVNFFSIADSDGDQKVSLIEFFIQDRLKLSNTEPLS